MSSNSKSPEAIRIAIKNAVVEISNSWLQAEGHRTHANEVAKHTAEEYEIDKKDLLKMAKMYHKQNAPQIKADTESVLEKYQEIFKEDLE